MYKVIGADGKEYGPVTEDRLRSWIAEGRANAQTRVQKAGETEWILLGKIPALANVAPPPPPAPAAGPGDAADVREVRAFRAERRAGDYHLDIGSCMERGWKLFKDHFWQLLTAVALVFGAQFAISLIPNVGGLANGMLGAVFNGGLFYFVLRLIRGQPAAIGDAFSGFTLAFLPLLILGIVSSILITLGFFLLIIPGVYLAVSWAFASLLVIDKQMDFWSAMELSRQMVQRRWFLVFGLLLLILLIILAGFFLFIIGIFVAAPFAVAVFVHAYEDIFNS